MKITIELPKTVTIASGNYETAFDWAKLPKEELQSFVARAACIGVAKAGNDAASGAKSYAEKQTAEGTAMDVEEAREVLIDKWINARYESGEFGAVRGGGGLSRLDQELISLVRPKVKALHGKAYDDADSDKRTEFCVEYLTGLEADIREKLAAYAESEIERKEAAKARREALDLPDIAVS